MMELLITYVSWGIISKYADVGSPCFMLEVYKITIIDYSLKIFSKSLTLGNDRLSSLCTVVFLFPSPALSPLFLLFLYCVLFHYFHAVRHVLDVLHISISEMMVMTES